MVILKPGIKVLMLELLLVLIFLRFSVLLVSLLLLLMIFTLIFFRDPKRRIEDGIISPADGKIDYIDKNRIEIFMGPLDAHVNLAPVSGIVKDIKDEGRKIIPAFIRSKKAKRKEIIIENEHGKFKLTLVAGFIARRIICLVEKGKKVDKGQKIGMIIFGSRVILEIPAGFKFTKKVGEKVKAGQTLAIKLDKC